MLNVFFGSNEHRDRHTDSQQPYEQDLYHNEPVHDTDGGTAWLCVAGSLLPFRIVLLVSPVPLVDLFELWQGWEEP